MNASTATARTRELGKAARVISRRAFKVHLAAHGTVFMRGEERATSRRSVCEQARDLLAYFDDFRVALAKLSPVMATQIPHAHDYAALGLACRMYGLPLPSWERTEVWFRDEVERRRAVGFENGEGGE